MENQYGITIRNKYDLFLNDQDPLEILQLQEQLKAAKKTEKAKKSATGVTAGADDKDSKSAKNKQIKAAAVVVTQEVKAEKAETTTTTTTSLQKKEDKPKRTKSSRVEDGTQPDTKPREKQPGKTGSVAQKSKEETFSSPTEFGNQTEFGHFEVRPSDRSGNRERRTRDGFGDRLERGVSNRDRGEGGFGSSRPDGRERSDRGGFGRERRPRGRYMGSRPPRRGGYSDDRQRGGAVGDDQERGLFTEGDRGGPGFGEGQGFPEQPGDKAGFPDQYERKVLGEYGRRGTGGGGFDDHGSFDNERHFEVRQERGNFEQRTFESRRGNYGERRNYEGRQDRGGFGERKRRDGFGEQENQSFGHWSEKSGDGEEREIRRGRGGFGRRGGRGRGRPGFGRREFGRQGGDTDQSGGVRGTEKREGSGAPNWGTAMDDLEGQAENQNAVDGATWGEQAEAAENQEAARASSARVAEEKGDGTNVEESAEEEPKVMTLDEWKALQATKRVKPEYNIRKPGEGCSDAQWKKMFLLTKKSEDQPSDEEDTVEFEEDKHAKPKNVLPIEITFTDNPRRGGRGGRRGGGSRGGSGGRGFPFDGSGYRGDLRKSPSSRGEREGGGGRRGARERAPNMADEHDFPSLDKAVPVQ